MELPNSTDEPLFQQLLLEHPGVVSDEPTGAANDTADVDERPGTDSDSEPAPVPGAAG